MKTSNGCTTTPLRSALFALVGAMLMSGTAVAAVPTYRIVVLPELPGTVNTAANDISDAGQVIGSALATSDNYYGITWGSAPYSPQVLASLTPNSSTIALAVNDAGFVVGRAFDGSTKVAVTWDPSGAIVPLGDLPRGPIDSAAYAINASGVAVGRGYAAARVRPVYWTASGEIRRLALDGPGAQDAGEALGLNDFGDMVGYYRLMTSDIHAARWPAGQRRLEDLGDLPGGDDFSKANAINSAGQAVGSGSTELGLRAVLWNSDGSMTDLGDLSDGSNYSAHDINQMGTVVGNFNKSGISGGFLWTAEDGMIDLYDLIDPADPLRAQFGAGRVTVGAINASGLIVGSMNTDPEDPYEHAIVLVPQEI